MPLPTFRPLLGSAVLALILPASGFGQANIPGPSFEQVIGLRSVGAPAISPDGRSVIFGVRTTDWKENRYDSELWLARNGEAPFQLTRTEKGGSGSARWSPDGRQIAFLADRGDRQQLYLIRADGGEAHRLTASRDGVSSFRWSPDGRRIGFLAVEPESETARRRRERFGEFAVEDAEIRQTHLWTIEVPVAPSPMLAEAPCPTVAGASAGTGTAPPPRPDSTRAMRGAAGSATDRAQPGCAALPEPVRLTGGDSISVANFAWSPDGRSVALERRADLGINASSTADLYLLDLASRAVRPLVTGPGFEGGPIWSPDGRWVLFSTAAGDTSTNFFANGQIARVAVAGGTPIRLAPELDEQIGSLAWTANGIWALAFQGTRRAIFRIDPESGRARHFSETPSTVLAIDLTPDGRTMALLGQHATTLPEVYRTEVAAYRPVAVTSMTEQVASWGLGSSEVVAWKSSDGERIEGVLHKPRGFDPSRKYPLFVVIHGGPTGIDYPTPVTGYVYPVMQWLAKEALVLRPNYRGSAGYGARFRALNVRNLGVGDAADVLSGVDHLVRTGIVDTTRMGAMGWSQGGYISAFLTTTSSRFRAVSVGAGISDWMTYYVNTDIHPFTRQYLRATPWDDPQIYARTSPITYIKQARTPTLIQHGEFDRRVPIANAYELFQGLQDQGVPTRLVVYKGFGHGIDKPREHLAAMTHNWQWFGRYIWGEPVEVPGSGLAVIP